MIAHPTHLACVTLHPTFVVLVCVKYHVHTCTFVHLVKNVVSWYLTSGNVHRAQCAGRTVCVGKHAAM